MRLLRSVFPPVNSVSFYSFLCKVLAVAVYIFVLVLLFGFFISPSHPEGSNRIPRDEEDDIEDKTTSYPLRSKELSGKTEIIITQTDLNRARKGPKEAVAVVNERVQELEREETIPDIIFKE